MPALGTLCTAAGWAQQGDRVPEGRAGALVAALWAQLALPQTSPAGMAPGHWMKALPPSQGCLTALAMDQVSQLCPVQLSAAELCCSGTAWPCPGIPGRAHGLGGSGQGLLAATALWGVRDRAGTALPACQINLQLFT